MSLAVQSLRLELAGPVEGADVAAGITLEPDTHVERPEEEPIGPFVIQRQESAVGAGDQNALRNGPNREHEAGRDLVSSRVRIERGRITGGGTARTRAKLRNLVRLAGRAGCE